MATGSTTVSHAAVPSLDLRGPETAPGRLPWLLWCAQLPWGPFRPRTRVPLSQGSVGGHSEWAQESQRQEATGPLGPFPRGAGLAWKRPEPLGPGTPMASSPGVLGSASGTRPALGRLPVCAASSVASGRQAAWLCAGPASEGGVWGDSGCLASAARRPLRMPCCSLAGPGHGGCTWSPAPAFCPGCQLCGVVVSAGRCPGQHRVPGGGRRAWQTRGVMQHVTIRCPRPGGGSRLLTCLCLRSGVGLGSCPLLWVM